MEQIPEEIAGVVIAPVISAVIEALKAIGMPTKYADLANVVLSGAVVGAVYLMQLYPDTERWIAVVLNLIVTVLMASGFYGIIIKRAKNAFISE